MVTFDPAVVSPQLSAPPLVAVVGPTGVGKSALGFYLARRYRGAIINTDSRLFYRGMDIGTSKPSTEERSSVLSFLFDLNEPDDSFSLAKFLPLAHQTIQRVNHRGSLPILVGGSGQYIWALLEGWKVSGVPPNPKLRSRLEREAQRLGPDAIFRRLSEIDYEAAARVDPRNLRRLIRAVEVATGRNESGVRVSVKALNLYRILIIGLAPLSRARLYQDLDVRIDRMLADGWLDEVRILLDKGYNLDLSVFSSMGYRELALCLQGELSIEEAATRIRSAHRRLVRRQNTWFKPSDPRIHWLIADGTESQKAGALLEQFLLRPE